MAVSTAPGKLWISTWQSNSVDPDNTLSVPIPAEFRGDVGRQPCPGTVPLRSPVVTTLAASEIHRQKLH